VVSDADLRAIQGAGRDLAELRKLGDLGLHGDDAALAVLLQVDEKEGAVAPDWPAEQDARLDTKDTAYQATPLTWAEHYLREDKGDLPAKQYAAIVNYLGEKGPNE
jgi:hypothetical protein